MKISSFEASLIRNIKFYMMIFSSIVCSKVSRIFEIAGQGQKRCWEFARKNLQGTHLIEIKKIKQNRKSIQLIKNRQYSLKIKGKENEKNGHKKIRVIFHLLKQLLFSEQTALKLKFWFDHFLIHSLIVIYQINLLFKI